MSTQAREASLLAQIRHLVKLEPNQCCHVGRLYNMILQVSDFTLQEIGRIDTAAGSRAAFLGKLKPGLVLEPSKEGMLLRQSNGKSPQSKKESDAPTKGSDAPTKLIAGNAAQDAPPAAQTDHGSRATGRETLAAPNPRADKNATAAPQAPNKIQRLKKAPKSSMPSQGTVTTNATTPTATHSKPNPASSLAANKIQRTKKKPSSVAGTTVVPAGASGEGTTAVPTTTATATTTTTAKPAKKKKKDKKKNPAATAAGVLPSGNPGAPAAVSSNQTAASTAKPRIGKANGPVPTTATTTATTTTATTTATNTKKKKKKKKVCRFFNSEIGCKTGLTCAFVHDARYQRPSTTGAGAASNVNASESASAQSTAKLAAGGKTQASAPVDHGEWGTTRTGRAASKRLSWVSMLKEDEKKEGHTTRDTTGNATNSKVKCTLGKHCECMQI